MNGYSARWLRQGFPWVYTAEVVGPAPVPGNEVTLVGPDRAPLGAGIADEGWISVRRFRADAGPVAEVLAARVADAWHTRRGALPPDTTAWRWIHAENDALPGIRVDVWGEHLVVSLDSPSLCCLLDPLIAAMAGFLAPRSVHVGWRPEGRDPRVFPEPPGCVRGEAPGTVEVMERGVRFLVEPAARKDIGLFPDMRDNRAWLDPHWRDRDVLNLYAYTGAFSVFAARAGGRTVTVDLSKPALARARENFALNGLDAGEVLEEDVFRVLDRFRRQERRFDRVILDPPGHSHGSDGSWSGEQDYARLVAAACRVVRPGGWLVAASNLGSVSRKEFQGFLADGARKAGVTLQVVHEGSQAPDFPAAVHFPEARYLKFVVAVVRGA